MKPLLLLCSGAVIGAMLTASLLHEQIDYTRSKHAKEIDRLTDSLAKCNGITARINKDSTYFIKHSK